MPPSLLRRRVVAVALACSAVGLSAACDNGSKASPPSTGTSDSLPASAQYYVAMGDSYAAGTQATPQGSRNTDEGYADQLVRLARARGYTFKLVNFGCGGVTISQAIERIGCMQRAVDGPSYGRRTQLEAAARFLAAHRGEVGLITVSLGGNDMIGCSHDPDFAGCVAEARPLITAYIERLLRRLRDAAGARVRIVGLSYPDVFLGGWVLPRVDRAKVRASIPAFQIFNTTLKQTYEAAGADFVDVTAATGAYGSLDEKTQVDPYGEIPVPVARICELTNYCRFRDVHPTTSGYGMIAELVANTLPPR